MALHEPEVSSYSAPSYHSLHHNGVLDNCLYYCPRYQFSASIEGHRQFAKWNFFDGSGDLYSGHSSFLLQGVWNNSSPSKRSSSKSKFHCYFKIEKIYIHHSIYTCTFCDQLLSLSGQRVNLSSFARIRRHVPNMPYFYYDFCLCFLAFKSRR